MEDSNAIFIFAPTLTAVAGKIAHLLRRDLPQRPNRVYTHPEALREALSKQPHPPRIGILLAGSPGEVDLMLSQAPWLEDLPLILRIPDMHNDTIAKAHQLRPRFLIGPRIDFRSLRMIAARLLLKGNRHAGKNQPLFTLLRFRHILFNPESDHAVPAFRIQCKTPLRRHRPIRPHRQARGWR
jgi:hypothetical protein